MNPPTDSNLKDNKLDKFLNNIDPHTQNTSDFTFFNTTNTIYNKTVAFMKVIWVRPLSSRNYQHRNRFFMVLLLQLRSLLYVDYY